MGGFQELFTAWKEAVREADELEQQLLAAETAYATDAGPAPSDAFRDLVHLSRAVAEHRLRKLLDG